MASPSLETRPTSPPAPAIRWTRSPTIHSSLHDGSLACHLRSTPFTVVAEMKQIISKQMNVVSDYRKGVGTRGGMIDKIIGGALGAGLILSVMDSFIHLAGGFERGDILIIVGFSRGGYAARILAALIAVIGIPKIRKLSGARQKEIFRKIRAGLVNGDLWKHEKLLEIRDGFKFYENVSIEALCVFDTVTAIGPPKRGLGRHLGILLKIFPVFRKDYIHLEEIIRVVPSNVRHFMQALPMQESRATYHEHVAQQAIGVTDQIFKQQWFFGNHGQIGQDNGRSCMVDAPFAWVAGLLHQYLPYLRLDEEFLHRRFPTYPASVAVTTDPQEAVAAAAAAAAGPSTATTNENNHLPLWIHDPIPAASRVNNLCHGWHRRTPGQYGPNTHESISPIVRRRGFGRAPDDTCMVPGYSSVQTQDGKWEWVRQKHEKTHSLMWPGAETKLAPLGVIPEGEMTPLEAALLGMAQ